MIKYFEANLVAAASIGSPVNGCRVITHLPLPEPVDEEEQEGQGENCRNSAGHESKPDVCGATAVFHLPIVAYVNKWLVKQQLLQQEQQQQLQQG